MKDETFVFISEVKEKAEVARSAKKACSRRRAGARLPSDRLTRREWEKMNGPCETYDLKRPMAWPKLKAAPRNVQEQYLRRIVDIYNVGAGAIAEAVGVTGETVRTLMNELEIERPRHAKPADVRRFREEFCGLGAPKETTKESPEEEQVKMLILKTAVSLEGPFDPQAVVAVLAKLVPAGATVRVHIEVEGK